jgi:hypothetical protein
MAKAKIARTTGSTQSSDGRVACAIQFIPAGARVAEIGGTTLKDRLPFGCVHRGVRLDSFTNRDFEADIAVLFDALRTNDQAERVLRTMATLEIPFLVNCADETDSNARAVDEFTLLDLANVLDRCGLRIETSASNGGELILRVAPRARMTRIMPCRVAVIGGRMTFAERLGAQMIASVLPGEADIHYVSLGDLGAARDVYDLVILGTGQGLCHPLFAPDVLRLVKSASTAIGIFGTEQRDLIPRKSLAKLLDHLDIWFARHRDDVLLFGRERDNVMHLGDWLITQFPLGQARDQELLTVCEESLQDLPLDRAIETIQRHRAVFAHAAAPLLCALSTADTVAYREAAGSSEFRGLLMDVFGRTYPAGEFFQVDREAVLRYRARVSRNVDDMREEIAALLTALARSNAA